MARIGVTALLAVAAWLAASSAMAQIASNLDSSGDDMSLTMAAGTDYAQGFTTGANNTGYVLTRVELNVEQIPCVPSAIAMTIWSEDGGDPDSQLYLTLSPTVSSTGPAEFTAQANASLDPETEYFLLMTYPGGGKCGVLNLPTIDAIGNGTETSDPGWSIGDNLLQSTDGTTWTAGSVAVRIGIYVTTNAPFEVAIRASRRQVPPGGTVTLSATTTGGTGTSTYEWAAGVGTFNGTEGSPVEWTAPATPQSVEIEVSATDTDDVVANATVQIRVESPPPPAPEEEEDDDSETPTGPDLTVDSPSVDESIPPPGGSFTLSAAVRNQGNRRSTATTLRYYRSTNASITRSDTTVGTDAVGALAAGATSSESIELTTPPAGGLYYYGACVDAVPNETNRSNNCSASVEIDVPASTPALPAVATLLLAGVLGWVYARQRDGYRA